MITKVSANQWRIPSRVGYGVLSLRLPCTCYRRRRAAYYCPSFLFPFQLDDEWIPQEVHMKMGIRAKDTYVKCRKNGIDDVAGKPAWYPW